MKILVKAYIAQNLGDDLFLKLLLDKYPQIQFSLIDGRKQGIYSQYVPFQLITFVSKLPQKILLFINRKIADKYTNYIISRRLEKKSKYYDAAIILGGSMFIQGKKGFNSDDITKMSIIKYFQHSFIIGANFGPYIEYEYISKYKEIFDKCDYISLRDKYSYELLGNMLNSSYYPDIVFQIKHRLQQKLPNTVGISVIDLSNRGKLSLKVNDYQNFIIALVTALRDNGKNIYLFSFCKQEGDETAIDRIIKKTGNDGIQVVKYSGEIDSFLDIYSSMEAMFCTRFHSMILSLLNSHYMIPLIYSKKMTQVLEDIDYSGSVIDLYEIEKVEVSQIIRDLYSYRYKMPLSICRESEKMFEYFEGFIKSNSDR